MVELIQTEQTLTAMLSGEIDHHSAKEIREAVDAAIAEQQPRQLVLDFTSVSFMDSSGIGLVIGRHRLMQAHQGTIAVQNPGAHIRKVMRLSGIDKLAQMK